MAAFPGTSYLATFVQSLRDMNGPVILSAKGDATRQIFEDEDSLPDEASTPSVASSIDERSRDDENEDD